MKKILAVLVVLAMVLSLSAVAFAADQVDVVKVTATADGTSNRLQFQTTIPTAAGDVVEIVLNASGLGVEVSNYCIRDASAGKFDHDGAGAENEAGEAYSADGEWVVVTATAKAGSALALTINFSEANHANGAYVEILSIKVGDKTYAPSEYVESVTTFSSAPASLTAEVVKVDAPVVGGGNDVTDGGEEETEGVEDTGVVSVAVVAVAAVVGGTVVLKKREF